MRIVGIVSLLILLPVGLFARINADTISISSPDKRLTVEIWNSNGRLSYTVMSDNVRVIEKSSLGLTVDNVDLGVDAIISNPVNTIIDEEYPVIGNHSVAHNYANETNLPIATSGKTFNLIVRVYDDGVAVRYTLPTGTKYINSESTTWNLPQATSKIAWVEFNQSYEGLSHSTALSGAPSNATLLAPLTFEVSNHFLSISEADCENFSDMALTRNGNVFRAIYPFSNQGWSINKRTDNSTLTLEGTYKGVPASPWRTTVVARSLNELVNSDLIKNLCPAPTQGVDYSWVKPGRCLWQWWSVGAPVFADQKNWYDAAAKLKWEYYLIDDGWRTWSQPGKDQWALLAEVIAYGKSVGVHSIVWVDSKEMLNGTTRRTYLQKVKACGADGIKIDFIPDATSNIIQWYVGTMQDCSELKLLLNFHGSVKPTGLERTYPNQLTREGVRGNEYHMTRYNRVAPIDQDVVLPFTRFMAGAADFTPVILNPVELSSTKFTWAHEFAQAIVYLSPVTHFTDQYKFYLESPMVDLFQELPTVWDETKVLSSTSMGNVVAFARRKGEVWWIGVMNGANARTVTIPLDFLPKPLRATLMYDNDIINTSVDRNEQDVTPQDSLTVKLALGGGFVARFDTVQLGIPVITPYFQIASGQRLQGKSAQANIGETILLSPESTSSEGTWTWTGPNSFSAVTREISLKNAKTGNYTVINTVKGVRSICVYNVLLLENFNSQKNVLPVGDYYIKMIGSELYWTNTNISGSGQAPLFMAKGSGANANAQIWTLSLDGGYYKIVSKADGRYVNEIGNFGTNPYYPNWNTFNIFNDSVYTAVQITQAAANQEKGTKFWNINTNNAIFFSSNTTIDETKDLSFEFVPVSHTALHSILNPTCTVCSGKSTLSIKCDIDSRVIIYNQMAHVVKQLQLTGEKKISLPAGIYFVKVMNNVEQPIVKVAVQ